MSYCWCVRYLQLGSTQVVQCYVLIENISPISCDYLIFSGQLFCWIVILVYCTYSLPNEHDYKMCWERVFSCKRRIQIVTMQMLGCSDKITAMILYPCYTQLMCTSYRRTLLSIVPRNSFPLSQHPNLKSLHDPDQSTSFFNVREMHERIANRVVVNFDRLGGA